MENYGLQNLQHADSKVHCGHKAGVHKHVGIGGWHARLVSKRANDGAEDHGGAKAGNEEAPDIAAVKAVVLVERIDIGTLKPVAGCAHAKV